MGVKILIVAVYAEFDGGMVGLVGLNDDVGVLMATIGAADDLSEKLKSAFFGGEIWEGETGIGLDDAEGGEEGEIEALGDGLGADDDVDVAVLDFVVAGLERFVSDSIGVKAGDFGFGEEFLEFGFEEFCAETFVDDIGVMTFGTTSWDGQFASTSMTEESELISMEGEGE